MLGLFWDLGVAILFAMMLTWGSGDGGDWDGESLLSYLVKMW